MTQVGHLSGFTKHSHVNQFFGRTYAEAVEKANKEGVFDFYYEQDLGRDNPRRTKTILVCWGGGNDED